MGNKYSTNGQENKRGKGYKNAISTKYTDYNTVLSEDYKQDYNVHTLPDWVSVGVYRDRGTVQWGWGSCGR